MRRFGQMWLLVELVWLLALTFFPVQLSAGIGGGTTGIACTGYDLGNTAKIEYDGSLVSHSVYDGRAILAPSQTVMRSESRCVILAHFGRLLAAEGTVLRNPNVYEALYEAPITGTTRAAQRTSANNFLANQLQSDAQLNGMLNQELGGNVLQHMESGSGSSFLNPPGTVWHHPFDNPNVMQLLRTGEHTAPSLQPVLHPGGVGGFGNFYAP